MLYGVCGRGVVAGKESAPWPSWAMLSVPALQARHLPAAFVMLGARLLFAGVREAGRGGSADVHGGCWRAAFSVVLVQEPQAVATNGAGPGLLQLE